MTLHIDGISVYELCRNLGNITQHWIERLVINDAFINPKQGIFVALQGHTVKSNVDLIPVFNMESKKNQILSLQSVSPASPSHFLFTTSGEDNEKQLSIMSSSSLGAADNNNNSIDWEA
jgi:hypothetical protein